MRTRAVTDGGDVPTIRPPRCGWTARRVDLRYRIHTTGARQPTATSSCPTDRPACVTVVLLAQEHLDQVHHVLLSRQRTTNAAHGWPGERDQEDVLSVPVERDLCPHRHRILTTRFPSGKPTRLTNTGRMATMAARALRSDRGHVFCDHRQMVFRCDGTFADMAAPAVSVQCIKSRARTQVSPQQSTGPERRLSVQVISEDSPFFGDTDDC
jgi:hypothetical protein